MQLISVRALSILLSLTLVVVTAMISIGLSVSTGEDALKKTETSGNNGIENAFNTAEVNIKILADSLMDAVLSTTLTFLTDWLAVQLRVVTSNRDFLTSLANTPVLVNGQPTLSFFQYDTLFAAQKKVRADLKSTPTTAILVTTATGITFVHYEDSDTIGATVPSFRTMFNNGTDRTSVVKNTVYGITDDNLNWTAKIVPYPTYDPMGQPYIPLVMGLFPEGGVGWSSISTITSYIGFFLFAPVSSKMVPTNPRTGNKVGFTGIGVDLRHISKFLSTVILPKGGLIFVVAAKKRSLPAVQDDRVDGWRHTRPHVLKRRHRPSVG